MIHRNTLFLPPCFYVNWQDTITDSCLECLTSKRLFLVYLATLFQWLRLYNINWVVINEWWIGKGVEESSHLILRHCPGISLEGPRKAKIPQCRIAGLWSRVEPGTCECEAGLLTTHEVCYFQVWQLRSHKARSTYLCSTRSYRLEPLICTSHSEIWCEMVQIAGKCKQQKIQKFISVLACTWSCISCRWTSKQPVNLFTSNSV
jgi:hypothetical protein